MNNKYLSPALVAIGAIALLVVIVVFALFAKRQMASTPTNNTSTSPTSTTPTSTAGTNNPPEIVGGVQSILYTNKDNGFEIWYPKTAQLIPSNDIFIFAVKRGIARIMLPESLFKGTNLIEAGVGIGVDDDAEARAKCTEPVENGREKYIGTATLGGAEFSVFEGSEGAAGHLYQYKNYRVVHDGLCYELVAAMNSGDIGVYEPGTTKEFDKNYISGLLGKIVNSFRFLK